MTSPEPTDALPARRLGLGCMRLSTTEVARNEDHGVAVIHAALDAGVAVLDTADAYAPAGGAIGHNERLVGRALASWRGDRSRITVATKGGMTRPDGAWVPDGRARHLREACEASARALGVDTIDLYQLHVVDPRTPLETSVRALARLQADGRVRAVGLCNVTVSQIRAARAIVPIASVQVSFSPLDAENLRNGVAEFCRDEGIPVLAYRPLGGDRAGRLAGNPALATVAAAHGATAEEVALAWLMSFSTVVPLAGATRVETAASLARAPAIVLSDADLHALDDAFGGHLLRVARADRRPARPTGGEVVIVMGMPGAGKSLVARAMEQDGFTRLNRDELGGTLSDLAARVDEQIVAGRRRLVLDNTYPTRRSRNEVIEAAWRHGATARCIWLATAIGDAQINAIMRMIEVHGSLPAPEEIRARQRKDPRYLLPDAQFRYERSLEPPGDDEGFASVERREFVRHPEGGQGRAVLMDLDWLCGGSAPALRASDVRVTASRATALRRMHGDGWLLFVHAWRPLIARGDMSSADAEAAFDRLRDILGVPVDSAACPHDAGPPVCWCRKPIPGAAVAFALQRGVALGRSMVIAASNADRTMAGRLGAAIAPPDLLDR